MVLRLFNSLTREKEVFIPLNTHVIKIYTCGLTVYDIAHIGHAKTYSSWDILKRYLRFRFPSHNIFHVQNYTDVGHLTDDADQGEDKIVLRARKRKVEPMELADNYIRMFEKDMHDLRISAPNIAPRATGHIIEMIDLVEQLMQKNFGYETERGIYYDVSKYPAYGQLAKINLAGQEAGARVEVDEQKRNPYDFALFIRASNEHIMKWTTPWDWKGYPGWHIECSAMSMKYLGEEFDIHGGGIDHLAIHHPNEQAQSEAIIGKPVVRYWLHTNHMLLKSQRMAKSTGNFISVREAIDQYGADLLRYYLVTATHYRSQDDFTLEKLEQKRDEFLKIRTTMRTIESLLKTEKMEAITMEPTIEALARQEEFINAMDDDLNTITATMVLLKFTNHLNTLMSNASDKKQNLLPQLCRDYQIFLQLAELLAIQPPIRTMADQLIEILLKIRDDARNRRDYKLADIIREQIAALGYKVEDKAWGTIFIPLK